MSRGTVVIVPGIGGNDLFTQPILFGAGGPLRIWLAPLEMLAGGWLLLGLDATGLQPSTPLTGPLMPGSALSGYYDPLSAELRRRGWDVWDVHLDWRQQLRHDAGRLADRVRQLRDRAPVALIGHSRGGLVIREALALLDASGESSLVGRCAALGCPHYGSWAAAGLVSGWDETAVWLELLLAGIPRTIFRPLPVPAVRSVVTSWPAAYELFPSPAAPGITTAEVAQVYNAALWASQGVPVSANWLAAAQARWAAAAPVPAGVEWVDFVGAGTATPTRLLTPAVLTSPAGWGYDVAGDSVVPSAWARWPGRLTVTCPTKHGALPYDIRVLDVLDHYLTDGLTADVVIEGRIV